MNRLALIAGATGLIGRRIARELRAQGGWEIVGLCRRPPAAAGFPMVAVDLTDAADARNKLAGLDRATHVFYAARYDHPEGVAESVEINAAMLRNVVEAAEASAPRLEHVHIVHGSKYYGHQLGPVVLPMREDGPRAPGTNFYFNQEDFIRERQRGRPWSYSISRPHSFVDGAPDQPRNIALLIAVYASILREQGMPLVFPGTDAAWAARTQFTSLPLLARAIVWMATEPRCANRAYNVVNGDTPRWQDLWPRFAAWFGMPVGPVQPCALGAMMAGRQSVWTTLVARRGLRARPWAELVLWSYGDYVFRPEWDIVSDMTRARGDGFAEHVDSTRLFLELFQGLRAENIIP